VRLVSASTFSTEAQIFFYTIYLTDNGSKKLKKKKTFVPCVIAAVIRTFVSEFVCHPVQGSSRRPLFSLNLASKTDFGHF
jgi:hypothetical protein